MRKKGLLLLAALLALCGCTAQSNIADVSRRTMLTVVLWDYDKTSYDWKSCSLVAPIWRDTAQLVNKAAWGRV